MANERHSRYFLIGFVALLIIASISYSFYSSNRMVNNYSLLVDAAMEVKVETTAAHLWLEEILSGDRYENIEDVTSHIDQAKWYGRAMLIGGDNLEGKFVPVKDTYIRNEVEYTLELIDKLKDIAVKRYGSASGSGVGTEIDQQFDRLYKNIIFQIDTVETQLQQKVHEDFSKYKFVQIVLFVVIVVLCLLAFFIQHRYDRELKEHIREIREAKESAEKNERWLKTTMNSMGDGVIITDHNGKVTYLNPVASSLTGWRLNEAKNKKMTEVFHIVNEVTKEPVEDPVNMVIRKNVVVGLANHTELIAKDGTVWPISDSGAPIFDHDNNLTGVVVVFHEITAQKEAETEKAKLEAQLRQTFKMEAIGTMAGGIAHDFNNILAIIIGSADMALDDIPEENPARHNVNQVLVAANRAKDLVRQILSFSRREQNKKEAYVLCRLIEESMKSLRSTIPTSVNLQIDCPAQCRDESEECFMVLADQTQIHQILLNLCVNAVQAMSEKGDLTVSVKAVTLTDEIPDDLVGMQPGHYECLSVSDTGPGMSQETIQHIFDPFFTTKQVGEGTGMGLSVVHGIVDGHGGKIFVESALGKGTTFHVYFPVTEIRPEQRVEDDGPLPVGNECVLFVDDEEMLASMGKDILERLGYSVVAKTDSVAALQLVRSNPEQFDLVITDQTMPNITGAELAEQLLKIKPGLPIILCTGYSSKVDKVMAKQIGVREFISKPLNRKDIAALIRKVLDAS